MSGMSMGLAKYTLLSFLAGAGVVYHAFATREQFYPATVYLSTSKIAVAVMGNLGFAVAMCLQKALIKVFLGSLRDLEIEMIRERLSSTVMESLLALTIFRDEFSSFFVAMFATLVFIKVLHWLVQDRVDYVEVTPSVSRLQHARLVGLMSALLLVDLAFLQYTVHGTIQSSGQSVMLLFAFEYVIQASNVIRFFLKYVMSMVDVHMEGRWETKSTYVFYLELVTDLLHLFVYCVFFLLVFTNYGLPLHLVRELYNTFRNFRNRIVDFLRFRQVTARLDRFPDASAEDLQRSDGVCIICREEMSAAGSNKKLFCGHVFHLHCLRSWLERQQNCPTCRGSVFQRPPPPAVPVPAAGAAAVAAAAAGPAVEGAVAAPAVPPQGPAAAVAADGQAGHPQQAPQAHQPHPPQQLPAAYQVPHLRFFVNNQPANLQARAVAAAAGAAGPGVGAPFSGPQQQQAPAAQPAPIAVPGASAGPSSGAAATPPPGAHSFPPSFPPHPSWMPGPSGPHMQQQQQHAGMYPVMMVPMMLVPMGMPHMFTPGMPPVSHPGASSLQHQAAHQTAHLAAMAAMMAAGAAAAPGPSQVPPPGFMSMQPMPMFMPGVFSPPPLTESNVASSEPVAAAATATAAAGTPPSEFSDMEGAGQNLLAELQAQITRLQAAAARMVPTAMPPPSAAGGSTPATAQQGPSSAPTSDSQPSSSVAASIDTPSSGTAVVEGANIVPTASPTSSASGTGADTGAGMSAAGTEQATADSDLANVGAEQPLPATEAGEVDDAQSELRRRRLQKYTQ